MNIFFCLAVLSAQGTLSPMSLAGELGGEVPGAVGWGVVEELHVAVARAMATSR